MEITSWPRSSRNGVHDMIQLQVAEASQCRNKTCSLRIVDQSRIGKTYGVKPQPPETQMDFVTDLLVEVRKQQMNRHRISEVHQASSDYTMFWPF
jgi:hypothetical protein